MSYHIMVDIEAMSQAPDAAIVSIGAVRLQKGAPASAFETFYTVINLKSAVGAGGKIDPNTLLWWMEQSDEVRYEILSPEAVPVEAALKNFSTFIREKPLEGIWGYGAGYDNVILESAYHRLGWTPAWTHRENRCFRTIKKEHPGIIYEEHGIKHNALNDAMNQARHLLKIWESKK